MARLTTEQILKRYEIAKRTERYCNCRGTGLYMAGLLKKDTYIPYMHREHVLQSLDLEPSTKIVEKGLVLFFGGLYSTPAKQEITHLGVSLNLHGQWRVLHRYSFEGEMLNETITDENSLIYKDICTFSEPPILKNKSLFEQLPNERVAFYKIRHKFSETCGIFRVLDENRIIS